jgi:HSP20 family protein
MTQLIPESWQQTLGHLQNNIQRAIGRWRHGPTLEAENGQMELMRRDDIFWTPSFPFRGTPGFSVEETDDDLIVTADVPELKREDYTIEIAGERLIIRGEQKQSSARHGHADSYAEQSYGAFMRILPLPREVDAEHAQARYKNGVLRMTLPKTDQAKSRRVKVQVRG